MKSRASEALLPDDLCWAAGGHASDVALTAVADGQLDIVPAPVLAHLDGCRACTTHLGNAALLSLHAGRELALLARADEGRARAAADRPALPRGAIALGLLVAALGLVPAALDGSATVSSASAFATHDAPLILSGLGTLGRRLFEPGSALGLTLTYGAAALLVVMALAVVRLLPTKEVSR
jgi:hypothetical protein